MARGRTFLLNQLGTSNGSGGTTNTLPKFTAPFTLGDSQVTDDGTTVAIITNVARFASTSIVFNENAADIDVRIESDANQNFVNFDAGRYSGVGEIAFGSTASGNSFVRVSPPALTIGANDNYYHLLVASGGAVTVPAGTAAIVASVNFEEPNIIATGTVSDAYTVRIGGAPTEGTRNGALWIAGGDMVVGTSALATNATGGFFHVPSCAGAPTGVPANGQTGTKAMVFDSTNNRLYIYDGGWISAAFA